MNDVRKPEFAEAISSLAGFAQISSDATRRLCEQGQSAVKTISERNTEVSRFLSHRVAQNGETLGRMTKCQNFPEVFAIQAQWVREAADDYLKEMSKLMEANSRIMSGMLESLGQVGMPSAAEMPTSPAAHSAFETPASPRCVWDPRHGFSPRRVHHRQGLQRRPKTSGGDSGHFECGKAPRPWLRRQAVRCLIRPESPRFRWLSPAERLCRPPQSAAARRP